MRRRLAIVLAAAVALGLATPWTAAQAKPLVVTQNYLAVGDSITAGAGVSSIEAFPSRLDAASKRLALAGNMSVSNATIDGVRAQLTAFPTTFPGASPEAVTKITLTVGANDIQWGEILLFCLDRPLAFPCASQDVGGGVTFKTHVDARIVAFSAQLPLLLTEAHGQYGNAKIYVAGYYELFGTRKQTCQLGGGHFITAADKAWYNATTLSLNSAIKTAVADANALIGHRAVKYVNVASRFNGHGFCDSATPWIIGPEGAAPGHPTAKGQKAYADAFHAAGAR